MAGVDLSQGESFGFLGFDFRRVRSRRGVWRANYTPKLKKRTALLRKLKDVFRRYQSQPVSRVVQVINPVLRGWVASSSPMMMRASEPPMNDLLFARTANSG